MIVELVRRGRVSVIGQNIRVAAVERLRSSCPVGDGDDDDDVIASDKRDRQTHS